MFRKGIRLPFTLAGIPLYLDLSFLLILPLFVWIVAANMVRIAQIAEIDPKVVSGGFKPLLLGLVGAVGLFACVVLHELGHSITAQWYGVKVRRITLWFLGGVAEFEEIPRERGREAVVGIAGPIVSFLLGALFLGIRAIVPPQSAPSLWLVCYYLMMVNVMLAVFNLLPALPLDGGRILRSLLALRMSYLKATITAGNVAKFIAIVLGVSWGLGLFGLWQYGELRPNLWMVVLAFFIYSAANGETQYAFIVEMLKGIGVREIMGRDVRTVPAWLTVGELYRHMLVERHKGFPVVDRDGRLIGMVDMRQLQGVDPATPVWQVMSTDVLGINERASALDAFTQISRSDTGRLIVFDDANRMVGIVTQRDLMRAIQVRMMGFEGWESAGAAVRHAAGPFSPPPDYVPTAPGRQGEAVPVAGAAGDGRSIHAAPGAGR
jgi:Zn-dependent protease